MVLFNFCVGRRAVDIKACCRPCRVVSEMSENLNDIHTTLNVRECLKPSKFAGFSVDCERWFVKRYPLRVQVVLSAACLK